jgi:hypothetical protein
LRQEDLDDLKLQIVSSESRIPREILGAARQFCGKLEKAISTSVNNSARIKGDWQIVEFKIQGKQYL